MANLPFPANAHLTSDSLSELADWLAANAPSGTAIGGDYIVADLIAHLREIGAWVEFAEGARQDFMELQSGD